jgi:hypothetical protein
MTIATLATDTTEPAVRKAHHVYATRVAAAEIPNPLVWGP